MRNKFVVHMVARKSGPHGKSKKAMRRAEKVKFNASVAQW
jgi:hypothetical protein